MAVTYGFYNSVGHDRQYDSSQISKLFDGLISDGIFMDIGTRFVVRVTDPISMSVIVGEGRAWFNHTWTLNDSEFTLTLDAADPTLPRNDAIVLEVNASDAVRANTIKVVKGTPSSSPQPPEMVHTSLINQYMLADIVVMPNSTTIPANRITSWVGQAPCPFVTGILQDFDMTSLIADWQADWSLLLSSKQTWFDNWFADIQGQLSEDAAGNLQLQIDAMRKVLTTNRTYYVRTGGNDSNDGLVDSDIRAFRTVQKAIDTATNLDMRGYSVTINVASGEYTDPVILKPFLGSGKITIDFHGGSVYTTGNNCIATASFPGMYGQFTVGGVYDIKNVYLHTANTLGGNGLMVGGGYSVDISGIDFGHCQGSHIYITDGGTVTVISPGYTVSDGTYMGYHCQVRGHGRFYMASGTVTISTNPVSVGIWIKASMCAIVEIALLTVSFVHKDYATSCTRYSVETNSVINTGGGGATYLPGDTAGVAATGGQYL